jgi:protein-disulfide isomerase
MEEDKENTSIASSQGNSWAVPGAVIIAGLLIAGALLYGGNSDNNVKDNKVDDGGKVAQQASALDNMALITKNDHILGDINAPIKIVEYSDLECPFCKRFHETTKQIMDEYGKTGEVALVFRHFPLEQLHSKAPKEAEATECAAELGGNTSFWAYIDRLFEITPSNNRLELSQLPKIATYIGLDETKFSICLESGKYAAKVAKDLANAAATGGRGTPWSIVVARDGAKYPINGALPYFQVKTIIESALR